VPKLVWRVKLVAELAPGVATETEVARLCNLISGNSDWAGSRIPVVEGDVDAI
jgi:hypothetical protein